MSDDLKERLRDRRVCSLAQNSCRNDWVCEQAADRIEELEETLRLRTAERNHANDVVDTYVDQVKELEAKLAKAVKALWFYACDCDVACEQLNGTCGDTAAAALRELMARIQTGEKDE